MKVNNYTFITYGLLTLLIIFIYSISFKYKFKTAQQLSFRSLTNVNSNKETFNNMYEDSTRVGPAFENPLSAQYFDPTTGKARPGTPGRLRYYKEAGYPLGNRLTLEQIKNTALEQPKGIKGYNKLVKEDYPWGVSPFIPSKLKDGGQPSLWDIIKMAQGGEMIRRADGSYSRRGLWDNIRANKGSGKKPTKQMLEQERKIKSKNK